MLNKNEKQIQISVIIVAYKNGEILRNTLNSIHKYNDIGNGLETIIIDNSPNGEDIKSFIKESDLNEYVYIRGKNNGFGAGNNIGARTASGDILAFINPDVYLVEPLFSDIYNMFMNNNKLMMLGCQLLDKSRNKTFSFFYDYETSIMQKLLTRICNNLKVFDQKRMFTSGCNMFIRKKAFDNSGGFDEKIFMYNEEADIKKRIIDFYLNVDIKFDKHHSIIHLGGSNEFSEKRFKILKDSVIYFGKKHGLDYKKKLKYEYNLSKIKSILFKYLNNSKKIDIDKEIECFEKYYYEFIK